MYFLRVNEKLYTKMTDFLTSNVNKARLVAPADSNSDNVTKAEWCIARVICGSLMCLVSSGSSQ